MAYTLAHLSDPHLNPLPRPRPVELMGKRATGFVNWLRSRRHVHDMAVLARVTADIRACRPDHVACTGDVTHIGLPAEFTAAGRFLDALGPRDDVSFVPGNHDAYVHASLAPLAREMAPWTQSDDGAPGYPWLKIRGHVALVGLSSAVPTGPLMAWGKIGAAQLDKAEALLARLKHQGLVRVVLIHHPPHLAGGHRGRELKDASAFEAMIAKVGAELVVHGHNHVTSLDWIAGAGAPAPVVGVASCSVGLRDYVEKAGWHLFHIPADGAPIRMERRGLVAEAEVGLLEERTLAPP